MSIISFRTNPDCFLQMKKMQDGKKKNGPRVPTLNKKKSGLFMCDIIRLLGNQGSSRLFEFL